MPDNGRRARKSLKESLRHFVPAWHTVVMGTGAVNGLICKFPFFPQGLGRNVALIATLFLTIGLFAVISLATVLRYALFKKLFHLTIRRPEGLFLGTIYMGVTTILNGALGLHDALGWHSQPLIYTLWGIWWLNSALSVITAAYILYVIIQEHPPTLADITPAHMLPFLPLVIASSTGGLFALALVPISHRYAIITIETSMTLLTVTTVPLSAALIAFFLRLIMFGAPKPDGVLTTFIPLGPLGQAALAFLYNGIALLQVWPENPPSPNGQTIHTLFICITWMLWAVSLSWAFTTLCTLFLAGISHIPFNIGFWGTIFPNAATALCSMELGVSLKNDFLKYFGAIWAVFVFILWCCATCMTIPAIWDTSIFNAPGIDQRMTKEESEETIVAPSCPKNVDEDCMA